MHGSISQTTPVDVDKLRPDPKMSFVSRDRARGRITKLQAWLAMSRSLAGHAKYLAPTVKREAYEERLREKGEVVEEFYGRSVVTNIPQYVRSEWIKSSTNEYKRDEYG